MGMEKRNLQRILRILSFYDVILLENVILNRESKMIKISRLIFSGIVFLFCFFLFQSFQQEMRFLFQGL